MIYTETKDVDIKNALNSIVPLQLRAKENVSRAIRSENTTDRDANGQAQYDQNKDQQKESMSEEEFQHAVKQLHELPAVLEHHLTVETTMVNGKKFALLLEPDGKVIRRISEAELWTLPEVSESNPHTKGQLLRKSA